MVTEAPEKAETTGEDFIFVCYSHANQEVINTEVDWLQEQGYTVWYDAHIPGGAEWNDELAQRIQECKWFLYFISPHSVGSGHCRNELNYAQQHARRMLAVEIEPTEVPAGLQLMLNARQILFRHKLPQAEFHQRLVDALELDADKSPHQSFRPSQPASKPSRLKWWPAATAALLLIAALVMYFIPEPAEPEIDFNERDWALVANLANHTDDPRLGEALENSLRIALEQSKYASILPAASVRAAKQRMNLDPDAPLDRDEAIELAQREDAKVSIVGDIAQLGGSYTISVEVIDPSDGRTVSIGSARAETTDDLLPAIDDISRQVRGRLGESLSSIQASSMPLAKVTTPNLEALRAYSLAEKSVATGDWETGLDLLKRAIEIDAEFAMAHGKVAAIYIAWARQPELAIEHYELALQNKSRLSPREQLYIEASSAWLKQPAEMRRAWKSMSAMFPNEAVGFNNLGEVLRRYYLDFEAAEEQYIASAERRAPWRSIAIYNVAQCQLALERPEEALGTFRISFAMEGHPVDYGLASTLVVLRRHDEAEAFISSTNPAEVPNLKRAAQFSELWMLADKGEIEAAQRLNARMLTTADDPEDRSRMHANRVAMLEGGDDAKALESALQEALEFELETLRLASDFAARPLLTRLAILARVAVRNDMPDLAEQAIAVVRKRLPGNGFPVDQAWCELLEAEILLQKGDATEALERAMQSIDYAELFQAHETLARIHGELGNESDRTAALRWIREHRGRAFVEDFDWFYGQLFNILDWSRASASGS